MFCAITKLKQLDFRKLMEVYAESNLRTAAERYPDLPQGLGVMQIEQEIHQYLSQSFFAGGGFYCVWGEGEYLAALRMEPYEQGLLLTSLETRPAYRNRGIATALITQSLAYCIDRFGCPVYSHVAKDNLASMAAHLRCGFRLHKDWAVYLDGSVSHKCTTLVWKNAPV